MYSFDLEGRLSTLHSRFPATDRRPVVGITSNHTDLTATLAEGYYKQVVAAGGTPVIVPPVDDASVIASTLDRLDALLLTGGADLNPLFTGEEPSPSLGGINAERDWPELLTVRLALQRQMPVLGICRGIQVLAVAMGGQVAQDLSIIEGRDERQAVKHSQDAARHVPTHTVTIDNQSILNNLITQSTPTDPTCPCSPLLLPVNSFHHQAVSDPGPHLRVVARAADGIIEAVESTEHKPIIGVQWHPECMGEAGQPLFRWLVGEAKLYRQAQRLHDRILTLDSHCDTPMFFPNGIDFARRDSRLCVDLHKMYEGRLDATIMVAYLPQTLAQPPRQYADNIFDQIEQMAERNSDYLAVAHSPADLLPNKQAGRKSILLGIENGLALEGRLENVEHFARRGIVYITLCHNGDNDLCDSAKGNETHGGVSAFGEQVIKEMNRLGILVDLSHAHERSFYDALDISTRPVACSHSSVRALCDHPRNLTDDQMRRLAQQGGVMQITLYPGFLRSQSSDATILDFMEHLDYAVRLMGIDHVGIGSDFDGDGGVPGLAHAGELLNYTRQLLARRYSEEDIAKLWGGNFLRLL